MGKIVSEIQEIDKMGWRIFRWWKDSSAWHTVSVFSKELKNNCEYLCYEFIYLLNAAKVGMTVIYWHVENNIYYMLVYDSHFYFYRIQKLSRTTWSIYLTEN